MYPGTTVMDKDNLHDRFAHSDQVLVAPLHFLDRVDLWRTVKPYSFHYFPKAIFPLSNLKRSPHETVIRNMRPIVQSFSLDIQGFEVHQLETKLSTQDFKDENIVQDLYFRELEVYFKAFLGAKEVRALDSQLRVKEPKFPLMGDKPHSTPQPSIMTHVDVTLEASKSIIRELYGHYADVITTSRFEIITVWRPLATPVRDWPLAVCDATTLDHDDLVPADIIYPNYLAENMMLHFNPDQKWYWLPDQTEGEVLVFKAVDSHAPLSSSTPHGAFPLPSEGQEDIRRRESIDVRLLVMYADIDYPESKPWGA